MSHRSSAAKPATDAGQALTEKQWTNGDMAYETRQIRRVALLAFVLNLGLAGLKGLLAVLSGSLAITAGAIDSATDSFASLAVYGGVHLSTHKSQTFPLGLYKIENLLSVIIALFIFFAGYEIVRRIVGTESVAVHVTPAILILLIISTAAIWAFGRYALRVGRRTESPTLIAEGKHRQVDVLSSLVVVISAALSYLEVDFSLLGIGIDRLAAAVVVLFILRAGWELLTEGMRVLLDASVDRDTLEQARKIILQEPLVSGINSLVGRNAGRFRFLQADVIMRTDNLSKAHAASERLQHRLREGLAHVERVLIHIEPHQEERLRLALPMDSRHGQLSRHFGEAAYFALVDLHTQGYQVERQTLLSNPYTTVAKGKGIKVAEWLVEKKVDTVLAKEDIKHKGPGYVFANAGVSLQRVDQDTLDQALAAFVSRQAPDTGREA